LANGDDLKQVFLGDVIVDFRAGLVIIIEVIRDRVFAIHVGDTEADVALPHYIAIVLHHFLHPTQAVQKTINSDCSYTSVHLLEDVQIQIINSFQKIQVFMNVTTLIHLISEEAVDLLQTLQPILMALFTQCLLQPAEVYNQILILILLKELFAAFAFQNLAEKLNGRSLLHPLNDGLHDLRPRLIKSHQLDGALIGKRTNQSAKIIVGSFLGLSF
jgi:hypothetical protein